MNCEQANQIDLVEEKNDFLCRNTLMVFIFWHSKN